MSRATVDRQAATWLAVVILLGVAFLSLPRPHGNVADHVHKEDGQIFLSQHLADPGKALVQNYTGYQHAAPRLITAGCAQLPAAAFAGCVAEASYLLRGLFVVVAFLVLLPLARTWRWALAGASLFLFVPVGQQEALGNMTNLRWFCDAAAVLMLCGAFRRAWVAGAVAVLAVICALSDPLAILIAPLALWRLALGPKLVTRLVPGAYLAATVVHWLVMDRSARESGLWRMVERWPESIEQILVRGGMVSQYGQNGTEVAITVVGLPLALLALALPVAVLGAGWRVMPNHAALPTLVMVLWGFGLLVVTISFADPAGIVLDEAWRVGQASRYSIVPSMLVGIGLILAASHMWVRRGSMRWVAGLSMVVLAVSVAADWPGDRWNTHGPSWHATVDEARNSCANGVPAVTVMVTPTGVPKEWSAVLACDWLD